MSKEEQGKKMGQVIARALADEAFKRRLLADATAVLTEEGIDIPPNMRVLAVENTDTVFHLVLPRKGPSQELSAQELAGVGGGYSCTLDKEAKDAWCWLNYIVGGGRNV